LELCGLMKLRDVLRRILLMMGVEMSEGEDGEARGALEDDEDAE
jgi:hypothetical protein